MEVLPWPFASVQKIDGENTKHCLSICDSSTSSGWTYCLTIVLLSQTAVWCYSIHHQASMASAQQCSLQSNKKPISIFHSPGVNPSWEIKTNNMIHFKHLWARATLLYIRLCLSWFPTRSLGKKRGMTASPGASSSRNGAAEKSLPCCIVPCYLPAHCQPRCSPLIPLHCENTGYKHRKYIAFSAHSPRHTCKKPGKSQLSRHGQLVRAVAPSTC